MFYKVIGLLSCFESIIYFITTILIKRLVYSFYSGQLGGRSLRPIRSGVGLARGLGIHMSDLTNSYYLFLVNFLILNYDVGEVK